MAKRIDFFDGAQSSTTPTIGNIAASDLVQYANDAAYEAGNAGAPTTGNLYYNTTDNVIRYYNGTSWLTVNKAEDVSYDNASSGLAATNVQAAIDETEARLDTAETNISTNTGNITNLEQLSGESGASSHAPFSGSTIPDSSSTRGALQALETEVETKLDPADKGVANGVAELDGTGKVPSSQLPTNLMEYQGDWNADTNSPTLANTDTGAQGNVYRVTTAGTTDFGAGNITFAVGDWAYNNGTTWEKSIETTLPDTDSLPQGSTNLYNQTHTGEVTGATALTVASTAITNKTEVTPESGDFFLFSDTSDSGNLKKADVSDVLGSGGENNASMIENLGIDVSVAAFALTVDIKQADGSSAPTSGNPVKVAFRNSNGNLGGFDIVNIEAALNVTIPSGATLGHGSGLDNYIYVYLMNNAGTAEMAVSSVLLDETELQSSSAISAAADDSTLYSTVARSNLPTRLIGRIKSNETTAGTWTAADGVALATKQMIQVPNEYKEDILGAFYAVTASNTWQDVGISVTLTPGTWDVGYHGMLFWLYVSGSSIGHYGGLVIADSSNVNTTGTISMVYNIMSNANDNHGQWVTGTSRVSVTETTTYKIRARQNDNTNATMRVYGTSFGAGLTDPDMATKIWARKVG